MKWWVILVLAVALIGFWYDSSSPYSARAHAALKVLIGDNSAPAAVTNEASVPLPPPPPTNAVPTDDGSLVHSDADPKHNSADSLLQDIHANPTNTAPDPNHHSKDDLFK